MSKELSSQEWYEGLVEECKAIITEAIFTSRWALVEGYWNLGKVIREVKILEEYILFLIIKYGNKNMHLPSHTFTVNKRTNTRYELVSMIHTSLLDQWNAPTKCPSIIGLMAMLKHIPDVDLLIHYYHCMKQTNFAGAFLKGIKA